MYLIINSQISGTSEYAKFAEKTAVIRRRGKADTSYFSYFSIITTHKMHEISPTCQTFRKLVVVFKMAAVCLGIWGPWLWRFVHNVNSTVSCRVHTFNAQVVYNLKVPRWRKILSFCDNYCSLGTTSIRPYESRCV